MERQGGYNYFGCKVCNVRGIPYTSETLSVHLQTKSHKFLKILYDNGMWPGLFDKYECSERRIQIYKFLDGRGTLLCETCNKVLPDSLALFQHQQGEEHRKILKNKSIDVPTIYMCDTCDILICGLENYYSHCWSPEHHNATEHQTKKILKKEIDEKSTKEDRTSCTTRNNLNGNDINISMPVSNMEGATDLMLSDISASDSSESNDFPSDDHNDFAPTKILDGKYQTRNEVDSTRRIMIDISSIRKEQVEGADRLTDSILKPIGSNSFENLKSKESATKSVPPAAVADVQKQLEVIQNFDEQKLKILLASLKDTNVADLSKSIQQVQPSLPHPNANLFDVLGRSSTSANLNNNAAVASHENNLLSTLSRLINSPQQQHQHQLPSSIVPSDVNQLMDQRKKEALNRLKYLIEMYIEKETLRLQQEHKKLMDIVQVKTKIQLSQETGEDIDMTVSHIVQMTEVIAARLNFSQNIINSFTPQNGTSQPLMTNLLLPSLQQPGSVAPDTSAATIQNRLLTVLAGKMPAPAVNPNMFLPNVPDIIRPRFVNTDDLVRQSVLNLLSENREQPLAPPSGCRMSRSRSPSEESRYRRDDRSYSRSRSRSPPSFYYRSRSRSRSRSSSRSRHYYRR